MKLQIRRTLIQIAKAEVIFYIMPLLMSVLVAGTVAQKYIGLYESQKLFFSSFIFWAGPLPLPGGTLLLILLTFSLLCKFLFFSEWRWRKAGIILTHLGCLVLLIGGIFTATSAREGYMLIPEGAQTPYIYDYIQRDLFIFKNDLLQKTVAFEDLKTGPLKISTPFTLTIENSCANCEIIKQEDPSENFRSMAQFMQLKPAPSELEPEQNLTGTTFSITGLDEKQDGTYIAFEAMPKPIVLNTADAEYKIIFGKQQRLLPFSIRLNDFEKNSYPGTDKARAFSSDIDVIDGEITWPARITMNHPLRYKGYTFYQSAFERGEEGEATILSVVENKGRLFPYIATAIIAAGLMLHLFIMGWNKKAKTILIFAALLTGSFSAPAQAQTQDFDYSAFRMLPILHEGRVQPLDSFARYHLKHFAGKEKIDDLSNAGWLAETVFNPAQAIDRPVFLLRDPDIKTQLGLPVQQKYFSLNELAEPLTASREQLFTLLQSPPKNLTAQQKIFIDLHNNTATLAEISQSFSLFLPLNIEGQKTYLDLIYEEPQMLEQLKKLVQQKGTDILDYSPEQQKEINTAFTLQSARAGGEINDDLRIMPPILESQNGEWLSPWQLILRGQGSPQNAQYLKFWEEMATAYRTGNADAWSKATHAAQNHITPQINKAAFTLEYLYNTAHPYHWALALYGLAVILLHFSSLPFGAAALTLAAALHSFAIASRIFILDRPPVGTLYESVIFVALIAALLGLMFTWHMRNKLPALSGSLCAAILLAIAPNLLQQGESMEMLSAVLNTNFWLATHVLCITSGYAVCVLTALLAHFYFFVRTNEAQQNLHTLVHRLSLLALLLTAIGTILGGIWADQSWGRFWGWDPKENGALLIVLWLIWAQHGKLSGHLKTRGFVLSMAALNIIVALAWFGVNLLNVGLHSYGFINGIAWGLGLFCTLQMAVLCVLYFKGRAA